MGKKDFFSPKAIANRMKAKGLQKLRWYCQTCQKQCRDENGFKCHVMSEGHQRQMQLFNVNAKNIVDEYSKEFESNFMKLLSKRYGTRRVFANDVYREYISDKDHLHMNATRWLSLTEFVKYLGREGLCVVDETERGWFIRWIDNSPKELAKKDAVLKLERSQKDQETRDRLLIQAQIQRGKEALGGDTLEDERREKSAFVREKESEKIAISLDKIAEKKVVEKTINMPKAFGGDDEDEEDDADAIAALVGTSNDRGTSAQKRKTAMDEILEQEILAKKRRQESTVASLPASTGGYKPLSPDRKQPDTISVPIVTTLARPASPAPPQIQEPPLEDDDEPWLLPNIIVKNRNKKIGDGKYYGEKAVVRDIIDDYIGELQLLAQPHVRIRVDQAQLETVIPAIGGRVVVVKGACRRCEGVLEEVDVDRFVARLRLDDGRVLSDVDYEWFCKLSE